MSLPASPAVLLHDLKNIISQRAAAGMGLPELGIPAPSLAAPMGTPASYGRASPSLTPAASDSQLRRLLIEKLGVQNGLRDDVFHQAVRLELDALLSARDRLRLLEGNRSQLEAVDRTLHGLHVGVDLASSESDPPN